MLFLEVIGKQFEYMKSCLEVRGQWGDSIIGDIFFFGVGSDFFFVLVQGFIVIERDRSYLFLQRIVMNIFEKVVLVREIKISRGQQSFFFYFLFISEDLSWDFGFCGSLFFFLWLGVLNCRILQVEEILEIYIFYGSGSFWQGESFFREFFFEVYEVRQGVVMLIDLMNGRLRFFFLGFVFVGQFYRGD